MNVYDFDKTIFYPDSMVQFAKFCVVRHPKLILAFLPHMFKVLISYMFGSCGNARVAETLNSVVSYLKDPYEDIELFWKKNKQNISKWYLTQKRSDDLIISASPEYLLKPITDELGVSLIATEVDIKTGVMVGNVCSAKEKAKYITDQNMPMIEKFYSDSLLDMPLALLAEEAYLVKNRARTPIPWPHLTPALVKTVRKMINKNT